MTARPDDPAAPDVGDSFDDDEEALRWEGDEERGGATPARRIRRVDRNSPDPLDGESPQSEDDLDGAEVATIAAPPVGRRVATGIFVVVYLLIVVGWVLSVQRSASGASSLFVEISWQFGEFLAMAAGVLAFGTVHSLTRDRRTRVAVGWWLLGAVLLLPWPILFLLIGGLRG